jgi:hypothetical protein
MEPMRRALPENADVIPTGVSAFIKDALQGNEFCPGQSGGISPDWGICLLQKVA